MTVRYVRVAEQQRVPPDGGPDVTLLDTHVEGIHVHEHALAASTRDQRGRLIERIDHVAFVAIDRLDAKADAEFPRPPVETRERGRDALDLRFGLRGAVRIERGVADAAHRGRAEIRCDLQRQPDHGFAAPGGIGIVGGDVDIRTERHAEAQPKSGAGGGGARHLPVERRRIEHQDLDQVVADLSRRAADRVRRLAGPPVGKDQAVDSELHAHARPPCSGRSRIIRRTGSRCS